MSFTYFILAVIVWLFLAGIRSLRIQSTQLSEFELNRRAKKQDSEAMKIQERERSLPDVRALRYSIETILFMVFIALLIGGYGLLGGLVLALAGLLLLPAMSRVSLVRKTADRYYQEYETSILERARKWHPFLRWLQQNGMSPAQHIHSKEEFLHIAQQADDVFSKKQLSLLEHGLDFQDKVVQEVMTPQSVIDYAEEDEVVGPIVLDRLHNTGHSRFPVIKDDLNHVVGMLYMHDMVPLDKEQKSVKESMRSEVYYIRQDATLEHALHAFLRTHHHLFIVVNEYRETVGLLSLEDVIETILGRKIVDEFDAHHDLRAVAETNPRGNNQPKKHEDV